MKCQPMKSCLPVKIESHRFVPRDFIGGDAALDFINTVTGRDQSPRDWLDSYTALLGWAALVRLLPGNILRALTRKAKSEHVLTLPTDRLRICHGPNCSWLFIDSSKAGRRRWCDMGVCGNDAKSRRFHARLRQRRE